MSLTGLYDVFKIVDCVRCKVLTEEDAGTAGPATDADDWSIVWMALALLIAAIFLTLLALILYRCCTFKVKRSEIAYLFISSHSKITNDVRILSLAISLCRGGYTYVTVFNLPARGQPHSVFGAFVHAGTICLFPDP